MWFTYLIPTLCYLLHLITRSFAYLLVAYTPVVIRTLSTTGGENTRLCAAMHWPGTNTIISRPLLFDYPSNISQCRLLVFTVTSKGPSAKGVDGTCLMLSALYIHAGD